MIIVRILKMKKFDQTPDFLRKKLSHIEKITHID